MGITTPISTNPAMTIGGLKTGVTPLDMAHAYETIAHGGQRVSGTLAEPGAPVGIESVGSGPHAQVDHTELRRVLPPDVASTETEMLETVLAYGTAHAAALGQFAAGKTGTTSNYGDAWFVGWNHRYTVAVWVGFPDALVPMTTEFDGGPVLGGTFPALIWHNFMIGAMQVEKERAEEEAAKHASALARRGGRREQRRRRSPKRGARRRAASPTSPRAATGAGGGAKSHASAPASAGNGQSGKPAGGEGGEGTPAPAGKSPPASTPAPAPQAPASPTPAAGGAPNQAPAPEASAPPASGGTSAPTGGASP